MTGSRLPSRPRRFILLRNHLLKKRKAPSCKNLLQLLSCRTVKKTPSRRKRQRYPAEKPREHQWCRSFDPQPGVFVCGRCKLWFNKRISARQHRKKCNDKYRHESERLANSLRDRRTPAQKRRETRDFVGLQVYRKQGRPPHPHHVCKYCS